MQQNEDLSIPITLPQACRDANLFKRWFSPEVTWNNWFVFLSVLFGLPITSKQREIYEQCTERIRTPPIGNRFNEIFLCIGRRGGKSIILSLIAVYLACFHNWRRFLQPGEVGTIMVIANDRYQARVIFRYIYSFIHDVPLLKKMLKHATRDTIELWNSVNIEVHTANFRGVRGYTIIAAILDELAFWRDENSANPDKEILDAIRPGMATIPGALLLCASSPYAKRGVLYKAWKDYYGSNDDKVLIWKAPTLIMNPTVSRELIDAAYERDPNWAMAEYGAEFRQDVENLFSPELIDDVTIGGRYEVAKTFSINYVAFVDPSGGAQDSFTLGIGHLDTNSDNIVVDYLKEIQAPFSPEEAVKEISDIIKSYGLTHTIGDHYAGEWPRDRFRSNGIYYELCDKSKSELYKTLIPVIHSRKIELLDNIRLQIQLASLERKVARGGRDSIDHPRKGHDDLANVVAGLAYLLAGKSIDFSDDKYYSNLPLVSVTEDFVSVPDLRNPWDDNL